MRLSYIMSGRLLSLLLAWAAPVYLYNNTEMVHITLGYLEFVKLTDYVANGFVDYAPAVTMALKDAETRGLLSRINISIVWGRSNCESKPAMQLTMKFVEQNHVDAIVGPRCTWGCERVSFLLSYWNKLFFSQDCSQDTLSNKTLFDRLVRVGPTSEQVGHMFKDVFRYFNWSRMVVIDDKFLYNDCGFGMKHVAKSPNFTVVETLIVTRDPVFKEADLKRTFKRIREQARVVILCLSGYKNLTNFMVHARRAGLDNGEYAYIFYKEFPSDEMVKPYEHGTIGTLQERIAAVRHVKEISMAYLHGPKINAFLAQMVPRLAAPPWNNRIPLEMNMTAKDKFALYVYDATMLYVILLNETIDEGKNPHDGKLMFEKVKNRTFYGMTGLVHLESNADRQSVYWVWHMQPGENVFQVWTSVLLSEPEGHRMKPNVSTDWGRADGSVVPDTPACGFLNEFCPVDNSGMVMLAASVATVTVLLLFAFSIAYMFYKRKKMEEELQQMVWKVKYDDIQFAKGKRVRSVASSMASHLSKMSSQSHMTSLAASTHSIQTMAQEQIFTKIAIYKNNEVAVKYINKKSIHLERIDLVELNMMREITHENVNPFIGASVEPPNICILTKYCQKGSLQDILENEEITLDWMFKGSLISDLANGMAYLHSTILRSHGFLKSGNCLVDSRWVLKISAYGLRAFRTDSRGFLWTAPELLRMEHPPRNGDPKADVYSFSIILQEILFRNLPYFIQDISPEEIVERVKSEEQPPFRPQLPKDPDVDSSMVALMKECWEEDPEERPTFPAIKKRLKAINRGKKFNIMDNMVDKLEKYANNLEDIVEQRTQELVEEKKKTDTLLYRMLPRSVAEALKLGKMVKAEVYEQVSIYFSDIVGFTCLSSDSTPMQVVDLLNDLYSMFDNIIAQHGVYKVETIGDAYMVVSGLPERNAQRHAPEIANMALDLLSVVSTDFKVRHRPGLKLNLRSGLHTGPCAAGVVGLSMPRYCLFGDSVNMASRMESNGEGMKIHISSSTYESLLSHNIYHMIYRGEIPIKGKGVQKTYWLVGKDGFTKPLPLADYTDQD